MIGRRCRRRAQTLSMNNGLHFTQTMNIFPLFRTKNIVKYVIVDLAKCK